MKWMVIALVALAACADLPEPVVLTEKTVHFVCENAGQKLELDIVIDVVVGGGLEEALRAYLENPNKTTAEVLVRWVRANMPSARDEVNQIVDLVKSNCST